jgi:hypothetical protein
VRTPSISRTPVIVLRFPARSRRHIRGRRERGDTVEVTLTTTRNPQRRWKWLVPMNRNSAHGTSFISSAVTVNPAPLVVFRVLLAYESEHLGDMADALVERAEDDADDVAEPLTGGLRQTAPDLLSNNHQYSGKSYYRRRGQNDDQRDDVPNRLAARHCCTTPSRRMKLAPSFRLYRFAPGASACFCNSGKTRLEPVATLAIGITRSNGRIGRQHHPIPPSPPFVCGFGSISTPT